MCPVALVKDLSFYPNDFSDLFVTNYRDINEINEMFKAKWIHLEHKLLEREFGYILFFMTLRPVKG